MTKYLLSDNPAEKTIKELEQYHPLVQRVLNNRGIGTGKQAELFLSFDARQVHDHALFKDMKKATQRIVDAISKNEKIVIYSDYDADGIPGAVVLHDFFKEISYENVQIYIPHRNKEGFGLNSYALDSFIESDVRLIITIDCGIADCEHVERAQKNGIDVIVTDHHEVGEVIPPAYAIINPKQEDCQYPEKMLCGSAVIFKVVQSLIAHPDVEVREHFDKSLLDMVGIATLSDMVPLQGENRLFAYYGIKMLQQSQRLGIQMLCEKGRVDQKNLTGTDVVFSITPKINAASRMDVPQDAFHLLSTKDEGEATELLAKLEKANNKRRGMVAAMVKEINKRMKDRHEGEAPSVIVTGDTEWMPSLLGLAANSIAETYHRPVFLWGQGEGDCIKGSCRGINDISLHDVMTRASDVFIEYGGHSNAGGFATDHKRVHLIEDALINSYEELRESVKEDITELDGLLTADDFRDEVFMSIHGLAPFGNGNKEPLFAVAGSVMKSGSFGKTGNHFELVIKNAEKYIKTLAFFKNNESFAHTPQIGEEVVVIGNLERNVWLGRSEIRMKIVDVVQSL